ncbi:MAG: hypothetical protein KIG43_02865, partial [Eubacteriales bacterium]|nr:hypothetical protein [Eubacteriales bacterium]
MKLLKRLVVCLIVSMVLISAFGCVPTQNPNDADGVPDTGNMDAEAMNDNVKPTVEPTLDPMADTREVKYVLTQYQMDPDSYGEKLDLPIYTLKELKEHAIETMRRCLEADDVTDMIPLYSYESALNLNFISEADSEKGKRATYSAHIIYDWTHPYVHLQKAMHVRSVLYSMPYGAIKYDADTNTGYMMYDLDNGMRLYHMLKYMGESDIQSATMTQYLEIEVLGNPAMMAKKTSFA